MNVGGDDAAALVGGRSRFATVNGVRLHYVEAGRGPLVVLLHGFPNFWYVWRRQIPALVTAGYRVVAADLRGYNLSEKPRAVSAYGVPTVARDVAELVRACGERDAVVVGHDWGGVIAWHLARHHAGVVRALVVVNAPHPAAMLRELRRPRQALRSSYGLFFQLLWLPELLLRRRDFAFVERMLRGDATRRDAFDDDDVRRHKAALARPGALTAALNYYRALVRRPRARARQPGRVERPVLVGWGMRDRYLSPRLLEGLEAWVPDLRIERFPEASHWVPADAPEALNSALVDFLSSLSA